MLALAHELMLGIACFEAEALHDDLHEVRGGESLDLVVHVRAAAAHDGAGANDVRQVAHRRVLGILVDDDLGRSLVGRGRLIEVELGQTETQDDGQEIPPLVVPEHSPDIGQIDGRLFFLGLLDDWILYFFCHKIENLYGGNVYLLRVTMRVTRVMDTEDREIQKEPDLK